MTNPTTDTGEDFNLVISAEATSVEDPLPPVDPGPKDPDTHPDGGYHNDGEPTTPMPTGGYHNDMKPLSASTGVHPDGGYHNDGAES